MKKIFCLFCVVMTLLSLVGCGAKEVVPDYEDVASFEAALNAGEDLSGKTVRFTVNDFVPNSAFGYNAQAGEHLNFCSTSNPKISVGDTVVVKVNEVSSVLGSWIITYKLVG